MPRATTPPPDLPETSILAVAAIATVPVPLTWIWPPMAPGLRPRAESRPLTVAPPPRALTTIAPVFPPAVSARIRPPASTRLVMIPSAARAVSSTVPPSARMVPVLVTSAVARCPSGPGGAVVTWRVTSIDSSPSP